LPVPISGYAHTAGVVSIEGRGGADKIVAPMRPSLAVVFFLSGAAALIYQIAWQRTIFVIYGLDAVPATIVVTAFMLGLGLGSLAGGVLSKTYPQAAAGLFATSELGIGVLGYFSLDLFDAAAGLNAWLGAVDPPGRTARSFLPARETSPSSPMTTWPPRGGLSTPIPSAAHPHH
jgi:hypothetical protein